MKICQSNRNLGVPRGPKNLQKVCWSSPNTWSILWETECERARPENPSVLPFPLGKKSKYPKKPFSQMTHAEMVPRPRKATGKCAKVGSTDKQPSRQVWDWPCTSNMPLELLHLGQKCKLCNHTFTNKSPPGAYYHDVYKHTHQRAQPKTTSVHANTRCPKIFEMRIFGTIHLVLSHFRVSGSVSELWNYEIYWTISSWKVTTFFIGPGTAPGCRIGRMHPSDINDTFQRKFQTRSCTHFAIAPRPNRVYFFFAASGLRT